MEMIMRRDSHEGVFALVLMMMMMKVVMKGAVVDCASLQDKCGGDMVKLSECLSYSTGKVDTPSDKCCSSVSEIRGKDPICLCYIIQQTHNASSQAIFSMGLQMGRLVQLPAACKIPNSNISDCPKILGIPHNSPDYAIFNGSAPNSISSTSTAANSTSSGHRLLYAGSVAAAVVSSIVLSVFSIA